MKPGEYWYSCNYIFCGEGTCGDWGSTPTLTEALEKVRSWVEAGGYDCYIIDPHGVTVFEHEAKR